MHMINKGLIIKHSSYRDRFAKFDFFNRAIEIKIGNLGKIQFLLFIPRRYCSSAGGAAVDTNKCFSR
jgi:hypothetical protein